eukprot:7431290-Ditylum_brightwellii.AAC.1
MPPVALDALALVTETSSSSATNAKKQNDKKDSSVVNRCVTLWAYIDERNGKLLDAGLERTVISTPLALTFHSASTLLEENNKVASPSPLSPQEQKAKAILSVAERNLLLWSNYHRQTNEAARKREERLSVKEFISKEVIKTDNNDGRDDGV